MPPKLPRLVRDHFSPKFHKPYLDFSLKRIYSTGGPSRRFQTRLIPSNRSRPKANTGGGMAFEGGRLTAEEGFSKGLASRC